MYLCIFIFAFFSHSESDLFNTMYNRVSGEIFFDALSLEEKGKRNDCFLSFVFRPVSLIL